MNSARIELVKEMMEQARLDYFIMCDPQSIDYCLDYYNEPGERLYALIISKNDDHKIILNDLFFVEDYLGLETIYYSDTDDGVDVIVNSLDKPRRIGVDKNFPARFLLPLMARIPNAKFINASPCVDMIRMNKDKNEQVLMIEASRINDKTMSDIVDKIKTGATEEEVADEIEKMYKANGGEGNSFTPIVAYGKNGANPHHMCDDSTLKPGDSIIIDVGCRYKGYCSDMTRTFFYKEASLKAKEVYELVKKANATAEAYIKPGVRLCDIDAKARDLISEAGYGPQFNHRLGHFIGRDVHEYGDVSANFDLEVEEGMIFSIEPGVYIPGEFGVRIEDLVLVTEDGCKVLNSYTKDLTII
ncbi:MAG: aminopeptidase P family protein [Thomasclavelia sp.]|jgi:Xaa-Pro dipeptidase|nr:aminopeptidase P family protein [Thomasclavelia sp.]